MHITADADQEVENILVPKRPHDGVDGVVEGEQQGQQPDDQRDREPRGQPYPVGLGVRVYELLPLNSRESVPHCNFML